MPTHRLRLEMGLQSAANIRGIADTEPLVFEELSTEKPGWAIRWSFHGVKLLSQSKVMCISLVFLNSEILYKCLHNNAVSDSFLFPGTSKLW